MRISSLTLLFVICLGVAAKAQTTPIATPSTAKLSAVLADKLSRLEPGKEVSREDRASAYKRLLEGQRYLWRMRYQRTQAGRVMFADQARIALAAALETDPTLSEGYVALTELSIMLAPSDLDEPAALSSLAVKLNKDSIGGHKFYARILTRQSAVRTSKPNVSVAAKAIEEWKEVVRLEPRNAEAWAMLSELYERTGKPTESIDSLKKWVASASPVETVWYRQIVGGQAEDITPENAGSRLSSALIAAGRQEEAVSVLTQILADDPDNTDVLQQIAEAVETADAKSAPKIIDSVRQIVRSNPGNVTLLISFAGLISKVGSADEAVKLLETERDRLVSSDKPAAANLQVSIGDTYLSHNRVAEAAAAYERSLATRGLDKKTSLDPDEREFAMSVFEKLINAYKRANKIDEAKSSVERFRKLLGNDGAVADRMLVSLYRDIGNRTEALTALRALRTKDPEDVSLLRLEATLFVETGQIEKGVGLIRKRIESGKTPQTGTTSTVPRLDDEFSNYLFIAQLYNDAGKGADAVAAADQAFAVAGSDDRRQLARLMKASAQQTAGQYPAAEGILREIIKGSPRNPIALNNLGYFLLERGERFPEAYELIRQAVDIDPTNPSYLDSLGWAHFKMGRLDEAAKYLEEAARLDDTSATIQEHLGDVYIKKGVPERARTAWQRAVVLSSAAADLTRVRQKLESVK